MNEAIMTLSASINQEKIVAFCSILIGSLLGVEAIYGRQDKRGGASLCNDQLQGRFTASAEVFQTIKMTAAHRSLPFSAKEFDFLDKGLAKVSIEILE